MALVPEGLYAQHEGLLRRLHFRSAAGTRLATVWRRLDRRWYVIGGWRGTRSDTAGYRNYRRLSPCFQPLADIPFDSEREAYEAAAELLDLTVDYDSLPWVRRDRVLYGDP